MSDLHPMPLLGHDLPLAADLRRQVRAKALVWKGAAGWNWRHDCGGARSVGYLIPSHDMAINEAVQHVKRCRP